MGPPTNVDGEAAIEAMAEGFILASMGPPTNVDGEADVKEAAAVLAAASMGPPTNVDGEPPAAAGGAWRRSWASMGPPTNVDGELTWFSRLSSPDPLLQWGRRQTSTERSAERRQRG